MAGTGPGRQQLRRPEADTVRIPAAARPVAAAEQSPEAGRRSGSRWRNSDYSAAEREQAKQAWRKVVPWEHPMTRGDKVLVFSTLGVVLLMLASMPVRPFLVASHPIALSAVTGSLSAIGAGAAFARIGEGELWWVIVVGAFGMVKFDWLFWLAGRRWGMKIIALWAPGAGAKRFVDRIRSWPRWTIPLAVVVAAFPGVPAPAVFALAGLSRMRLVPFLIADAIGAGAVAGLVAGLGYGVGQHAVDVVLVIDDYALWITLGLVVLVSFRAAVRGFKEDRERKAAARDGNPRS
ncbi:DedA family protein [Saccharothrix coeruleofusca]|uniref:Membrane protein DedA with SNARE-associated domain n=1 Tax=Saccharothrix coeruleofusca TaxID=33919 RepID=A0A918AL11_9PSEU|nr:DedA family protein [Saccharothrix coeruleofusca]GGP43352.1 hypothetical protein GCM10010185_13690 [Saccharothrix coeruleofusca]